ncbi:SIMPL domain-containing protein [Sphingosinicellaceae bacterium]|nr:SIMPL domain-containing protein [Sphingosinicellaceae bacterium]
MSIRTAAAIIALAAALPAAAQQAVTPVPTLSVSAEGKSLRVPDVAELSGGVVTTAPTAAAAMAENAQRMSAVVAAVRKAGIAERDIQTAGLSLQPQYRYENNQAPILTGYQATNTVSLRLRKLPDAGRLLDTLVSVGANQISGPSFRVDDSDAALDEARVQAVATARARGDLYAKAAGVRIKRILTISESGDAEPPRPMMMMARASKMAAADTPVVPGEVALTVTVNVTFELE